jgi:hypothetical protein
MCLSTGFQHPVSEPQNGAGEAIHPIPMINSIRNANSDLRATGAVRKDL